MNHIREIEDPKAKGVYSKNGAPLKVGRDFSASISGLAFASDSE
jgi:hypothetical protein